MKQPKNRLHKVIVIGATPAGIAATNKLGELGIPVTMVDASADLDQKLAAEQWRLLSGAPFNYAHRSGLLRILRNPLVQCIMPARVTSLKHTHQGFSAKILSRETFIDPSLCTLCGRCAEICPVTTPSGKRPILLESRMAIPGRPVIEKGPEPPCQGNCPLGVNAQGYIALAGSGRFKEALNLVRRDNILPGICGRVCTHPCEEACRRGELDAAVSIRNIKRFLADYELNSDHDSQVTEIEIKNREEKIAVIGSGPAGLAASGDLARLGYKVTVFEKEKEPGGLLRYGIGAYRLPREILDYEIRYIQRLGVEFVLSHPVDLLNDLQGLQDDYDAVILAGGAWADRRLGVPGEDLDGVQGCISFLSSFYRGEINKIKRDVAVIGDGNAAFDLARTLRRLGAEVTIVSWFPEGQIPADPEEVTGAKEEGIIIKDRTQVIAFEGENNRLSLIRCMPTEPGATDFKGIAWPVIVRGGKEFDLKFDLAFVAIGQKGPFDAEDKNCGVSITSDGFIEVDGSLHTSGSKVYAAGDAVTGPSSVVGAMARGRAVACSVHVKLEGVKEEKQIRSRPVGKDFAEIPRDIPSMARPKIPERQPASRLNNFMEVSLGLNNAQVFAETERCLQCGICSECLLCAEACREIGAINHYRNPSEEVIENAGVVVIADPEAAPSIKGEDVIRAYGPKAAKSDIYAMITRGFAAASDVMTLLGGTSQRPKGHGVFSPAPDPELSLDIRIGVFVCRCNDSLGWLPGMDEFVDKLTGMEDVIHVETMSSACVKEGTANILRVIREKGITRVVLASCVCCPLDFICSACTDQRTRLKNALFKASGVSRAMVETCNLRGEALRHMKHAPSMALENFKGLIGRAIQRAKKLIPLPTPSRTYNFATAVIGESEATVESALAIADAGLEVLMFGTPEKPLSEKLNHFNIQCFDGSSVNAISGTLGNFQIYVQTEELSQVLQVGAVIVGERFDDTIKYSPQEGLHGRDVTSVMQKRGVTGIPFLLPGMTSVKGLFLASPPGLNVSERKKGAAAAVLAAAIMPKGPRPSRGYTVVVDELRCRGCGRCITHCPYQAVTFQRNAIGGWFARVDEALCKGCGNCISVCPTNAADSPYRSQTNLEQMLEEVLAQ
ncbi:4Fe-4S binding domain protein [uncultured Desulfobacterium sp.]|uniref:4Fe-4S binding domain protein n=1 Tax=uncultured Desulfobacterium sp. TaxID=201089 RepID=A0A445N408_9BACT|nr:4Fe-4S binding domain protein [uncultured Desulfobacterium sp.]